MELEKKGLTGTEIKLLGLIFMIMDHLGHFFTVIPVWFRYLGRLSAPLFIYMLAEGYYYTRNKKEHIKKMYIWALVVFVGNILLERYLPIKDDVLYLSNNIFLTFAISMSIMYIIDKIREDGWRKETALMLVILIILGTFLAEGSIIFVGLGVMFYAFRDRKTLKFGIYITVSLLLAFLTLKNNSWELKSLLDDYQWLMIFSVFIMELYNGERGRGLGKNFFYLFYPAHIWILYLFKYILVK